MSVFLVEAGRGEHGISLADDAVLPVGGVQAATQVLGGDFIVAGRQEIRHPEVEEHKGMPGPFPQLQLEEPKVPQALLLLATKGAIVVLVGHREVAQHDRYPGAAERREDLFVDAVLEAKVGAVREQLDMIHHRFAELPRSGGNADLHLEGGIALGMAADQLAQLPAAFG